MGAKPSYQMVKCMQYIRKGMVPHQAAVKAGIERPTMYKSRLYKEWKAEQANSSSGPAIEINSVQEGES